MRKFNLRDQVVKRIRGLEHTAPVKDEDSAKPGESSEKPIYTPSEEALRVISRTDIGLVRKSNQDAIILGSGLMGVADGMGGHNGGETASAGARDGMIRETEGVIPGEQTLDSAIRRVNLELWEMQLDDSSLSGMGTTLTVLWPAGKNMLVGHVGDSRAYLLREGMLQQITEDHSMVADMMRRGLLTEEQAACHPMRNYITRAVGTENDVEPDILSVPREKGDRWLICSDGLHGPVARERLRALLSAADLDEGADQMIREALDQGGRDNVTLVIVEDLNGGEEEIHSSDEELREEPLEWMAESEAGPDDECPGPEQLHSNGEGHPDTLFSGEVTG